MMIRITPVLKEGLPFAVTISLVCSIIYFVVQQNYRNSANDPQYQMASEAVNALGKGAAPKALVPATPAELTGRLSPYLIIYDDSGNVAASAVVLNDKIPKLPKGVLDYVKNKGEEAITWQPRPGIRQALVIRRTELGNLYYVAAGRSLRNTEKRISMLSKQVFTGWVISLVLLFAVLRVSGSFIKAE